MERKSYLTPEDLRKLIEGTTTQRNRLLLTVLAYSGVRISEALALRPQDIDPGSSTMMIPHLKSKDKNPRMVAMPPIILEDILAYARENKLGPQDRIFPFTRQMGYYIAREAAFNAGMDKPFLSYPEWKEKHFVSPHRFRDAVGTNWAIGSKSLEDLRALQEALGHAHLETTQKYFKLSSENLRRAYSRFMESYDPLAVASPKK